MATQDQLQSAKEELSDSMNSTGMYNKIQVIAKAYFNGKVINNDSDFWYELEERIIDMIEDYEE